MSWPTPQEYNEAIQNPSSCFVDDDLKRGKVSLNKLGLPAAATGAFASVYKISGQGADWAVRCFLNQRDEQEARYRRISEFVLMDDIDATVPFHYIREGMLVRGEWYPILKMNWVSGETLDVYLRKNFRDAQKMNALIDDFQKVAQDLATAGIAHGDLQHGNMLVTEHGLRLVDYDALYVPGLEGMRSLELGHPNYQHPRRTEKNYDTSVDNFSCWLIKISLQAIAIDPDLFERFGCGEEWILLRRADLCAPEQSPLFNHLLEHPSDSIKQSARILQRMLWESPEKIPELNATEDELDALPSAPPAAAEPTSDPPTTAVGTDYVTGQDVPYLKGGFIDSKPLDKRSKNAPFLERVGKAIGSSSEQLFRKSDTTTWSNFKFNRADKDFRRGQFELALPQYLELYNALDSSTPRNAFVSLDEGLCKAMVRAAYCYGFLGQQNLAHNCFLAAYNRISRKGSNEDKYRIALLLSASHFLIGQKEAGVNVLYRKPGIERHLQRIIFDELQNPGYLQCSSLLELVCAFLEEKSFDSFESPLSDSEFEGLLFYSTAMWLFERMGQEVTVESERMVFRLIIDSAEFMIATGTPVDSIIMRLKKVCYSIHQRQGRVVPTEWGLEDYLEKDDRENRRTLNKEVLESLLFEQRILFKSNKEMLDELELLSPWVATKFILKRLPYYKSIRLRELVLDAVPTLHPRCYPLLLLTAAKHSSVDEYKELINHLLEGQGIKPRKRS